MCDVSSCCGCVSLYKGCLLIGVITIIVSLTQAMIFSVILFESYDSSRSTSSGSFSRATENGTIVNNQIEKSSPFYLFSSQLCPFGFIPLAKKVWNDSSSDFNALDAVILETDEIKTDPAEAKINENDPKIEADQPKINVGEYEREMGRPQTIKNGLKVYTNNRKADEVKLKRLADVNIEINNDTFQSIIIINDTKNSDKNNSDVIDSTAQVSNSPTEVMRISCLAPSQGVLWALVIASCLYIPVGIILIFGIRKGNTLLLSTWFFYTVAYNLLALIVALTDGVYTGAADVSSYLVCVVTAYCIIVVDSYYEKLLLEKKTESTGRGRPNISVVRSGPTSLAGSPDTPSIASPALNTPRCLHTRVSQDAKELLITEKRYGENLAPV